MSRRYSEKPMTDVMAIARKISQALDVVGYLRSQLPLIFYGHRYADTPHVTTNLSSHVLESELPVETGFADCLISSGDVAIFLRECCLGRGAGC
jgi:hypothetical protein